jgi:hypothetical protein
MFEWKNRDDKWVAKFVLEHFERAKTRRRIYEPLWEIVTKIFRPRRYDILSNSEQEKGQQFGATVYDQHPANAMNKSVAGLIGYMVSRSSPWIAFVAPDVKLMQFDHIKQYCQEATEQVLYAAARSNLYSAVVPHALDAYSVGTSCIIPNKDELRDRVVFDVVHPRDSYLVCDSFGYPLIYFRSLRLTRLSALEICGRDRLPNNWFKKDKGGAEELKQMLDEEDFIYAVFPNNDRDTDSALPEDKAYIVFLVYLGSNQNKQSSLFLKSGKDIFPTCWRQMRESGADYGTSLSADCLTSGLVCNKLSEKELAAVHQMIEPAGVWSKTLKSALLRSGTNPGARIYADDINREGFKPIMDRLNWPVSDAQLERKHAQIDDRMFIKFFEMLSAGDIKSRTAYEVSQAMGEKAALMTSIVDTFEEDSIENNIQAIILYETEQGRMPEPPEELVQAGGRIDIRYLGPLAQLQRTLLKSKGTVDAIAIIQQLALLDEAVLWKFNFLEAAEEVAVNQGWPQKNIRSDKEVEEIRQQVQQQREALQQAELAEKGAKAVGALGKRVEPGSPAEGLSKLMPQLI